MKRKIIIAALALFFLSDVFSQVRVRPQKWAQKMIGTSLENWHKIDERIYRSEQPEGKEFALMKNYGIAVVLNLRNNHSNEKIAKGLNLKLYNYGLSTRKIEYSDLVSILKIIKNEKSPLLIHCWHGADRTGTIAAAYRIVFHNWTKEEALDELINGGYGYHSIFKNIPELIKSIDEKRLRNDVFK